MDMNDQHHIACGTAPEYILSLMLADESEDYRSINHIPSINGWSWETSILTSPHDTYAPQNLAKVKLSVLEAKKFDRTSENFRSFFSHRWFTQRAWRVQPKRAYLHYQQYVMAATCHNTQYKKAIP